MSKQKGGGGSRISLTRARTGAEESKRVYTRAGASIQQGVSSLSSVMMDADRQ